MRKLNVYACLPEVEALRFKTTFIEGEIPKIAMECWDEKPHEYRFETKVDGHQGRMFVGWRKKAGSCILSRRVSAKTGWPIPKHRTLPALRDFRPDYQAIFEGELAHRDLTKNSSDATTAICNGSAVFFVWDILSYNGKTLRPGMRLRERLDLLTELSKDWPGQMQIIPSYPTWHAALAASTEGFVAKHLSDAHTYSWVRVIKVHNEDVMICGYTDSDSVSYASLGWIATIDFAQFFREDTAKELKLKPVSIPKVKPLAGHTLCYAGCCSGFDRDTRKELSENRAENLGRIFTVKSKGLLESGMMRQPRFDRWREDKRAHECVRTNNLG